MFTGIVEEVGSVSRRDFSGGGSGKLTIEAGVVLEGTRVGDSISVSGACQTVVETGDGWFAVEVMPETARRTTLGGLRPGDRVNLERALRLGDRLGGHLVNGHVDAVGAVRGVKREENAFMLAVEIEAGLSRYLISKGSVTVDGVSLTVVGSSPGRFTVSVIPHTMACTTLGGTAPGAGVNIEVDIIAKYVESLAGSGAPAHGLESALLEGGFLSE